MGKTITLREARLHAMRGNSERPAELIEPESAHQEQSAPIDDSSAKAMELVALALGQVSDSVTRSGVAGSHAMQAIAAAMQQLNTEPKSKPASFEFRITERDRVGNIVAFTATRKE